MILHVYIQNIQNIYIHVHHKSCLLHASCIKLGLGNVLLLYFLCGTSFLPLLPVSSLFFSSWFSLSLSLSISFYFSLSLPLYVTCFRFNNMVCEWVNNNAFIVLWICVWFPSFLLSHMLFLLLFLFFSLSLSLYPSFFSFSFRIRVKFLLFLIVRKISIFDESFLSYTDEEKKRGKGEREREKLMRGRRSWWEREKKSMRERIVWVLEWSRN